MKYFKQILTLGIILSVMNVFSQNNMSKDVSDIVKLGRDSIIQKALKILDAEIDLTGYNVKVMASNKDIYITFDMPVKFVPLNSEHYYGAYVNFIDKMNSKLIISNPRDFEQETKVIFFKYSEASFKHIDFVLKAVNMSNIIGNLDDIKSFKDDMTIREYKDYYDIVVLSYSQESWYKIEKRTGRIYDEGHAHLVLDEDDMNEEAQYKEIK